MKKRTVITAAVLALIVNTAVFGTVSKVAVFPYYTEKGALEEEYDYAVYMIPDMIRIKMMESGRFLIFESYELEQAAGILGLPEDFYVEIESCLEAAADIGADYLIRGYLYSDEGRLTVVHSVFSVADGKTLHMEKQKLPEGKELLELLENSADLFAEWLNSELPDPEVPVVVIERETVIEKEKLVEVPVEGKPEDPADEDRTGLRLSAAAAYRFYFAGSAQYLDPNLSTGASFLFQVPEWDQLSLGFRISVEVLNQRPAFYELTGQEIKAVQVPVILCARLSFPILSFLSAEAGLGAGGSVVFGFVEPEVFANFSPVVSAEAGLHFFPESFVSFSLQAGASAVFNAYEAVNLFSWQPSAFLNFNF